MTNYHHMTEQDMIAALLEENERLSTESGIMRNGLENIAECSGGNYEADWAKHVAKTTLASVSGRRDHD